MVDRDDPFEMRMGDDMHRQQMGAALRSYGIGRPGEIVFTNEAGIDLAALRQRNVDAIGFRAFRQELDELVRSIVIDKNRARDLPAFESACVALGYIYDKDECALYREEVVRVVPETKRTKVV